MRFEAPAGDEVAVAPFLGFMLALIVGFIGNLVQTAPAAGTILGIVAATGLLVALFCGGGGE